MGTREAAKRRERAFLRASKLAEQAIAALDDRAFSDAPLQSINEALAIAQVLQGAANLARHSAGREDE